MKKIIYLLVFALFATSTWAATTSDSLRMANEFYSKKKYDSALEIYTKLVKSGYESPVLFYNTGNAYYKLNDFVHAIVFYERALLLDPNNEDCKFNLEVARTNQVDKLDVIPVFFAKVWVRSVAGVMSSNTWVVCSVLLFVGVLLLVFIFLFSSSTNNKRTLFGIAMFVVVLSGAMLYMAFENNEIHSVRTSAIVVTPSVNAKSSPDDAGTELFVIHEGLKVEVIDKVSGWVKIKLSNGSVGWLKVADIEVI